MADSFSQNLNGFANSGTAAGQQTGGTKKKTIADFLDPTQKGAVQALGEQRVRQIIGNLRTGQRTDPGLFQSLDTFRNAYGYNQADPGKRAILDAYVGWKAPNLLNPAGTGSAAPVGGSTAGTQGGATPTQPQSSIAPIGSLDVTLGAGTQAKGTSIGAPQTGNKAFDTAGQQAAGSVNQYTGQTAANANLMNQNLTGLGQAQVQTQQAFENQQLTSAQRQEQLAQELAGISTARLDEKFAADMATNKSQIERQSKLNKRMLASANLLASLTGGTGGSAEFGFVRDTEQEAVSQITALESAAQTLGRAYRNDLREIGVNLFSNISKINDSYANAVITGRQKLFENLTNIEATKGKNTQAALDATYSAVRDYTATITNLTKEAENLKLQELKLAEDARNNKVMEGINAAKLELEGKKFAQDAAIENAKLEIERAKATGTSVSPETISTFADAIINKTATIANVPENLRGQVLGMVAIKDYPEDLKLRAMDAVKILPSMDRRSDADVAFELKRAISFINQGLNDKEVKKRLIGINDKTPEPIQDKVLSILNGDQIDNLKTSLNNGDVKTAVKKMENFAFENAKINPEIRTIASTQADLIGQINGLLGTFTKKDEQDLGSIGTTLNNFATKFTDTSNVKINKLQSLLASLNSEERKRLLGSAVSKTEAESALGLFGETTMNLNALKTTMDNVLRNNVIMNYNNARSTALLDPINVKGSSISDIVDFININNNPDKLYQTQASRSYNQLFQ